MFVALVFELRRIKVTEKSFGIEIFKPVSRYFLLHFVVKMRRSGAELFTIVAMIVLVIQIEYYIYKNLQIDL